MLMKSRHGAGAANTTRERERMAGIVVGMLGPAGQQRTAHACRLVVIVLEADGA
jgi:hypothetical protein